MKSAKDWLWAIVFIWVASGLQQGLMPVFSSGVFTPDILLPATIVVCMFARRSAGAFLGFLSGLFMGAILGVNVATIAILRTLSGLGVSSLNNLDVDRSPSAAAIITASTTLIVQLITLFIAPKAGIGSFLLATIVSAVVNGVLAIPVFLLANRLMDPARR